LNIAIGLCSPITRHFARLRSRSIKVATFSHTLAQTLSNISTAIPAIAAHIPGGWDNIQSLMLKTNTSVSLPIWCCSLGERWIKSVESGEKREEVPKKLDKGKKEQTNKKRPVQEGESEESKEENPRKKVKSDKGEK